MSAEEAEELEADESELLPGSEEADALPDSLDAGALPEPDEASDEAACPALWLCELPPELPEGLPGRFAEAELPAQAVKNAAASTAQSAARNSRRNPSSLFISPTPFRVSAFSSSYRNVSHFVKPFSEFVSAGRRTRV